MTLTEDQKRQISQWLEEGLKLAEVQTKLSKAGINITYMELKFLLADLQLKPKDQERPPEPASPLTAPTPPAAAGKPGPAAPPAGMPPEEPIEEDFDDLPPAAPEPAPAAGSGNVTVKTDQVTRAGAIISGNVTFSDGKVADWYIDQMGRLGIASREAGYRPAQADVMAFQTKLQAELAKLGF